MLYKLVSPPPPPPRPPPPPPPRGGHFCQNTAISEDRKSGIITISVTDRDPQRAAAIANAYVDELNSLVAQLSTSAAHREREFLEDRLKVAKVDLDEASNQLAQFSSKNNTLDIQVEGKATSDAAGSLAVILTVAGVGTSGFAANLYR